MAISNLSVSFFLLIQADFESRRDAGFLWLLLLLLPLLATIINNKGFEYKRGYGKEALYIVYLFPLPQL